MRILGLALALLISCCAAAGGWYWFDRPVPVEPSWHQPLSSVSFAPFRRGQSPLTKVYPTPQQIDQDLQSLSGLARGIRTYTSREGMEVVPDLAAKHGLKVIFSAWLGNEKDVNERELDALIKAANAHPDAIDRVIVGNEVLLRRDLKPDELIAAIRKVKAAVKQPVSYADVWAFYLKYPEVGREVDFITIHILPFWEDEPVAIDHVEPHVVRIVDRIREAFPGKPILIGEAGWPSLGRDRGPAVVNAVNEARFVRQMADIAARHDFDYNIVEAFDQPWKSALENTVGAAWGIMDVDRRAKFALAGPVVEVPDWPLRATIAIVAGAIATLWFARGMAGFGACLAFALSAQLLSWLAVTTGFHAEAVSFRWWQDVWAVFRGGFAAVFGLAVLHRAAIFLSGGEEARDPWRLKQLTLFAQGYAIVWTLLLLVDGRYRDIPEIDFSVPTAGLLILALIRLAGPGPAALPKLTFRSLFPGEVPGLARWLGGGLLFSSVAALASEGLAVANGEDFLRDHPALAEQIPLVLKAAVSNREMVLWAVMLLVMAIPAVAGWLQRRSR